MSMRVTTDPVEFQAAVFPFLTRDPVLHTIIIGNVAQRAVRNRLAETGPSYFVSAHDGAGDVIGVAMRTPGRPVCLGALPERLAAGFADAYAEPVPDLAGVAGTPAAAEAFADRWCELFGATSTEVRGTRLHTLGRLARLRADGEARRATADDVRLAAEWVAVDFGAELAMDNEAWARDQVKDGNLWFWQVGGTPVSMVGHHPPVLGVCRVGPVYTPVEFRRHGYAGALTSHVSGEIVARGHQACLFTNRANSTSNKIYAAVGYLPVADFVDRTFSA